MSAKKRGPGRPPKHKTKVAPVAGSRNSHPLPKGFWPQIGSILLVIVAILLFIGLFGVGGNMPIGLAGATRWLLGWTAFLLPFLFVYQSIQNFRRTEDKTPGLIIISTMLFISVFSALFQISMEHPLVQSASDGGGAIGWMIAEGTLRFVNIPVAALIYVAFLLVLVMFVFAISPKGLYDLLTTTFKHDNDNLKNNAEVSSQLAAADNKELEFGGLKSESDSPVEPAKKGRLGVLLDHKGSDNHDDKRDHELEIKKPDRIEPVIPDSSVINNSNWKFPAIKLLSSRRDDPDAGNEKENAEIIESTLAEFGIGGSVEKVNLGPRVAQYCLKPQRGVSLSKITSLRDKFSLNLATDNIRIEAPIPGQPYVGIEIPNRKPAFVNLRSILESKEWAKNHDQLAFAVGLNITGEPIVLDLASLPHLLIAGTTGSGKSVMMNVMIVSMLYRNTPDELKMVLVDPKGNEMTQYDDMPHLIAPTISGTQDSELHKLAKTLLWLTDEMERRYELFRDRGGIKKIADFKKKFPEEKLPNVVLVVDEYTDLLDSMKSNECEIVSTAIQRIAQKGRAAGIHEVIMMQAPRAKYLQGPLKANIPAGFAFAVRSKMESQQIINASGAEQLMGKGDMLMITSKIKKPRRVQAANVSDEEIESVVNEMKMQSPAQYDDSLLARLSEQGPTLSLGGEDGGGDNDYRRAVEVVISDGKASTSYLQRRLKIGYSKAARLMDEMEENGVIGPQDGSKPREVLISSVDEA